MKGSVVYLLLSSLVGRTNGRRGLGFGDRVGVRLNEVVGLGILRLRIGQ